MIFYVSPYSPYRSALEDSALPVYEIVVADITPSPTILVENLYIADNLKGVLIVV